LTRAPRRSLAIEFVENTSLSVGAIAGRAGFSEVSYSRKVFPRRRTSAPSAALLENRTAGRGAGPTANRPARLAHFVGAKTTFQSFFMLIRPHPMAWYRSSPSTSLPTGDSRS
jgi:hypothetical protein